MHRVSNEEIKCFPEDLMIWLEGNLGMWKTECCKCKIKSVTTAVLFYSHFCLKAKCCEHRDMGEGETQGPERLETG